MLRVACLCPTYKRPRLVANALACFEAQTYPYRRLFVLDDANQFPPMFAARYQMEATPERYPSLPAKYARLMDLARDFDAIAVWDDDDIYLPHHLAVSLTGIQRGHLWSKPSQVHTLVDSPKIEDAAGRFHGSLVFRRDWLADQGGWPATGRMDFDLQLIARSQAAAAPWDPCTLAAPSYVFRWASTGDYHSQAYSTGPADEGWYHRHPGNARAATHAGPLLPQADAETADWLRLYGHAP